MFAIIASLAMTPSVFADSTTESVHYHKQLVALDDLIEDLTKSNHGLRALIENRITDNAEANFAIAVYEHQFNVALSDNNSRQEHIDELAELLFDLNRKVHVNNSVIQSAQTEMGINFDRINHCVGEISYILSILKASG